MFGSEVIEKLDYYVYRLLDPRTGETFYVGKGRANRVFQHAKGDIAKGTEGASEKLSRIHQIQLSGFQVAHVIHRHGMDERTAYEVEAALIEAYPGIANIMGGHNNDERGLMHADEITRRYEAPFAEFRHPVVMLNVNRLAAEISLYNATRYAWRISLERAKAAQYVLPVVQGIIRGAFIADKWLPATAENFPGETPIPGRYGFFGRMAPPDIVQMYAHRRVPADFRKQGAASPVRYHTPPVNEAGPVPTVTIQP